MDLKPATRPVSVDQLLGGQTEVAPPASDLEAALTHLSSLELRVLHQDGGLITVLDADGEQLSAQELVHRLNDSELLLDPEQQYVLLRALLHSSEAQRVAVTVPGGRMGPVGTALLGAAATVATLGSGVVLTPVLEALQTSGVAGEMLAAVLGLAVLFGSPGAFVYVWARLDGRLGPEVEKRDKPPALNDEDVFVP